MFLFLQHRGEERRYKHNGQLMDKVDKEALKLAKEKKKKALEANIVLKKEI